MGLVNNFMRITARDVAMQNENRTGMVWPPKRRKPVSQALVVFLVLLTGCSIGNNIKPETDLPQPSPAQAQIEVVEVFPSVTHLEDGREGFIIKEEPSANEEWFADFERAVSSMEEEDYPKAIELLEKVVEYSPEVSAPYINIAICYERTGKHELAEQHLKTALEMIPEHPAASLEYGFLLRKTGRFAEAREIYEKSLATYPEYYPIRKNLGILCDLYLKDMDCALEQYEKYSKGTPEDEKVKLWIADLRLRQGGG